MNNCDEELKNKLEKCGRSTSGKRHKLILKLLVDDVRDQKKRNCQNMSLEEIKDELGQRGYWTLQSHSHPPQLIMKNFYHEEAENIHLQQEKTYKVDFFLKKHGWVIEFLVNDLEGHIVRFMPPKVQGLNYDYGDHTKRCRYFSGGIKEWCLVYPMWNMTESKKTQLNECVHAQRLVILDFTNMRDGKDWKRRMDNVSFLRL